MKYSRKEILLAGQMADVEHSDMKSVLQWLDEAKEKLSRSKPEASPITQSILSEYFEWYKRIHDGIEPKMAMADMRAAKEIGLYLQKVVSAKTQNPAITDVVAAFRIILDRYPHKDKFYASQLKLSQIGSNLTNLISIIKQNHGRITGQNSISNIAEIVRKQNSGI